MYSRGKGKGLTARKRIFKKLKKPLDRPHKVWYNTGTKQGKKDLIMTTEKIIYIVTKENGETIRFDNKNEAIYFAKEHDFKLAKEITRVTTLEYQGNGIWN